MATEGKGLLAGLSALKAAYAAELPPKVRQVEMLLAQLESGQRSRESVEELGFLVHSIAGAAGTFGMQDVTAAARAIEAWLQALGALQGKPSARQCAEMHDLMASLRRTTAGAGPAGGGAPIEATAVAAPKEPVATEEKLVLLVDDDQRLAELIALDLGRFGYRTHILSRPDLLESAVKEWAPCAIIMDVIFPEDASGGPKAVERLGKALDQPPPTIFISGNSDIATRLQAVRAGGKAFLVKPVDASALVDKLDELLRDRSSMDPYRVLIVENSVDFGEHYAGVLRGAGMMPRAVANLDQLNNALEEFRPELILMDMYMSECDGAELAQVIRQHSGYVSVPIVFLSKETDLDRQLAALDFGDEFLIKPIQPAQLISAVGTRVERHRLIRSFMTRDGLTGLLNHTRTKEELDREMARAARTNRPVAFAMIDIDQFKRVNDTYGHAAGDGVIKRLTQLLRQRLRKTDLIGRYGGEEFAVVFPDTDANSAAEVLDRIRADLAQMLYRAGAEKFTVTFSAGVADYPRFANPIAIGQAADKALYDAKHQGRNRVCVTVPD